MSSICVIVPILAFLYIMGRISQWIAKKSSVYTLILTIPASLWLAFQYGPWAYVSAQRQGYVCVTVLDDGQGFTYRGVENLKNYGDSATFWINGRNIKTKSFVIRYIEN